uniref:Uncharacterized protein n=1 Tax=Globodera rostochiensis TaxID=31243 RepID=A0A914GRM2_GLORO
MTLDVWIGDCRAAGSAMGSVWRVSRLLSFLQQIPFQNYTTYYLSLTEPGGADTLVCRSYQDFHKDAENEPFLAS